MRASNVNSQKGIGHVGTPSSHSLILTWDNIVFVLLLNSCRTDARYNVCRIEFVVHVQMCRKLAQVFIPSLVIVPGNIGPFFSCPENLGNEKTLMTRKFDIASDAIRNCNSNRYSTFLLIRSNLVAAVISVRASKRHFLFSSLELFSPDFDDTSVPTERNDEFGSGNDS